MNTFKLWHDEDKNTFHQESRIFFSQCSKNGRLSLSEVLKLASDTAVEDYRQRGLSREFLVEHGFFILVSRSAFRFHSLPRENEQIELCTWEEKPEALQLCRAYEFTGEDGRSLISGLSTWLLVDPVARKIIPTKHFTLRTPPAIQKEHDCFKPAKITVPQDAVLLDERKIRYSDIDGNGHTNNSRYGAFVIDALPEAYRDKDFCDFKINFSKEAMLGDTLQVFGSFDDAGKKITVKGQTEQGTSFESELYYR